MAQVVAVPVSDLLNMVGNKAFGFGLKIYPETNGADGVIRVDNNSNKPEWRPTGPFRSKGGFVEVKHIEVKRDKVILNHSLIYDRAGFIAVHAPILNDERDVALNDAIGKAAVIHDAAMFASTK